MSAVLSHAVQSHGILLALREPDLIITVVSSNTHELLGIEPQALLGRSLGDVLEPHSELIVREASLRAALAEVNPLKVTARSSRRVFHGMLHRADHLLVLELEPTKLSVEMTFTPFYRNVRRSFSQLHDASSVATLAEAAATEMRRLTGFDRVLVYRFTAEGTAEVIGEATRDQLESFVGIYYPSNEANTRARELLQQQSIRVVTDTQHHPVPLLPATLIELQRPLDLARASLRAVEPCDLQYCVGGDTRAVMTVALRSQNGLWGMVVCEHDSALWPPYEARGACELVAELLASQVAAREERDVFSKRVDAQHMLLAFVEETAGSLLPSLDVVDDQSPLANFLSASGVAVTTAGQVKARGATPSEQELVAFAAWLSAHQEDVFACDSLSLEYPNAPQLSGAIGVLAVSVSQSCTDYVIWLRTSPWQRWEVHAATELHQILIGLMQRAGELQRLNHELRTSSLAKDEFLATVSHELRTPLNAMLGWLKLLESGQLPPSKRAQAMETITRNARVQAQLVEDLLDVSRIISGKMRLDMQAVEPGQILQAALASVQPAADAKSITLLSEIDPTAGIVLGDSARIQQVVWNLLNNAVKFTPNKGVIKASLARVGSALEIAITDSGAGISAEFLPHVFERFRQANGAITRTHKGLGLGLSIVRHLVELHGGQVAAWSDGEGTGATFTVRLPLGATSEAREPQASAPRTAPPPRAPESQAFEVPPHLQGLRVVAVDDEPDCVELLRNVLETCGVEVIPAASALEAKHLVMRLLPDALISDIGMPEMDGFDLVKQIRALPPEQGGLTPAIALTAYARSSDRSKAFVSGFDVYLSKPVEAAELVAVLGNVAARVTAKLAPIARNALVDPSASVDPLREKLHSLRGMHVLAVEDDADALAVLDYVLSEAGATVVGVGNAAAASAAFKRHIPDVVLTDISLPDKDGYALLKELRLGSPNGWIAVAMTGYASPEDARAALDAGFQVHLAKPIEPAVLIARLAGLSRRLAQN